MRILEWRRLSAGSSDHRIIGSIVSDGALHMQPICGAASCGFHSGQSPSALLMHSGFMQYND
jgi:hypothetical protein